MGILKKFTFVGSVKAGKSFSGIVLSWNFAFFTTDFIVSFWSFCSISTSPAGRDERIPANLSQKTVVDLYIGGLYSKASVFNR